MLRCPIDGSQLHLVDDSLVKRINEAIEKGELRDRQDQKISDPIDGGLTTQRGNQIYPVRGSIPTLVADAAFQFENGG
ncbi:Trm112 family protein [Rubripirellula lacrimiformis]|nr:Trm112 family protein [Rubripirellula lacrimiformis]